jgi:AcrR family transcriptional regulator
MPRAPHIELPTAPKKRRTQAERTAETRGRIIAAVTDLISERGFARTTAQEICTRAGVTWGAVQHHFGGKDGILTAVLEASFNHFADRIAETPVDGVPLNERVSSFVDKAWQHYSSRHYRTTFEILLNVQGRDAGDDRNDESDVPQWQGQMYDAWNEVWISVFPDARPTRRREFFIQHYTLSVLSGLAATLMLQGDGAEVAPEELDLLKQTILAELDGG